MHSSLPSHSIEAERELRELRDELAAERRLIDGLIDLLALPAGSLAFSAKLKSILAERDRIRTSHEQVW